MSVVRSGYIAKYLQKTIGCQIIDNANDLSKYKIESLFLISGAIKFCPYRIELLKALSSAKQIIFCINDYESKLQGQYLQATMGRLIIWSNYPDGMGTDERDTYVNWNMMTWHPPPRKPLDYKYKGIVYYGRPRKGRMESLKQFFGPKSDYPIHIFYGKKHLPTYHSINPKIKLYLPFKNILALRKFQCTLYLEDKKQHTMFHSLANRFYECLSQGIPIYFDHDCHGTCEGAGLVNYERFLVKDAKELSYKLNNSANDGVFQQEYWAKDYPSLLKKQITDALAKL